MALDVGVGIGMTFETWVKPSNLSSARTLFAWLNGSGYGSSTEVYLGGESINVAMQTASGRFIVAKASAGILLNQFQHIAVTYDKASGEALAYVNGSVVASRNLGSTSILTTGDFYMGYEPGYCFAGLMDEVALYNRALTSNEIAAIYQAGSAGKFLPAPVPLPSGCVAWWRAENNFLDSVGTNHGTVLGTMGFGAGKVAQAFTPGGAGSGVLLGNPASLQLQTLSIEAWVKRANASKAGYENVGGGEFIAYGPGGYAFGMSDNGSLFISVAGSGGVDSYLKITDTNYHHAAVVKSGSSVIFYIDGVADPMGAFTPTFSFTTPVALGTYAFASTATFMGQMDELAIYNRALGSNEIAAIYMAGGAGKVMPDANLPNITSQPLSQTNVVGSLASFSVKATGAIPLSNQWRFNGTNFASGGRISGTTSTNLTISNVQLADAGNYTVVVTNVAGAVTSTPPAVLTVYPTPLVVTNTALQAGTVGMAYSQSLAATGGVTPYTWSVVSGALPTGLLLSTTGVITGTPTTNGTANFTVQAKDALNTNATRALSIIVNPAALVVATATLPTATVGTAYNQNLAATGGVMPYTWSVVGGSLPTGLSCSTAGVISGTPTTNGTANFTVQAKDTLNTNATRALSITVNPAALVIVTGTLPAATVGTAYNQTLTATGGVILYTWSVVSGSLPTGLLLSTAGVISGTPTTNTTANFTVQAKDAWNTNATRALSMTVNPAGLVVSTATLPVGAVGTAYSQSLSASGGTLPYSWSVVSGSLPAGLSLGGGGTLSGTPTTYGTNSFRVMVRDANNATAQSDLILAVLPAALNVTTVSLLSGRVAYPYSLALSASGGVLPYAWSLASGSLPAGLTLSTNGVLAGTPSAAGSNFFQVQVRAANSVSAQRDFALVITNSTSGMLTFA
ncbi:MAG: putative Ig domain-containing protein, partial [Verrucomicrobia bacterium]|nr:putative Ig domain-containing protein [Verrucomicrobiota bacterium]